MVGRNFNIMIINGNCIVCNTEIDIEMCCNGNNCGCLGQPIHPPVCSEECYNILMKDFDKYYSNDKIPVKIKK